MIHAAVRPLAVAIALLGFALATCQGQTTPDAETNPASPASRNVALGKPVTASSEAPAHPAGNAVDGKISRTSKWEAANGKPPHVLEVDLQKYYAIDEVRVHSGILDAEKRPNEKTQAAGFWSLKNFKVQYWDDANWSDFPNSEVHENRLASVVFRYNTPIITFKIRVVCDDGEAVNVMELEAFGKEAANMPAPPTVASDLPRQGAETSARRATITIGDKVVGKTFKYVGYNQGYYLPGTNVSGWLEYSNVNSLRLWTSLNSFIPTSAVQTDDPPRNLKEFDRRKGELRKKPESNRFIRWDELTRNFNRKDTSSTNAMVFSYALAEAKRLGMDVVLQSSNTDFEDTWANKWQQWQRYYALAFHAAKAGDVEMFAMQNEPNHRHSGPMKLETWIMGMQIVSDAIHCAIEDVNRLHRKKLTAKFVGPVTAGHNTEWWSGVAKAIRTNYRGETIDHDLIQIFSTHSYNSPAVGYASRVANIRDIIKSNHPAGGELPIAYTEIGRWMNAYLIDKQETMDSPSLFTEWAGIYANNMKNGAYGMWAFKLANTASGSYPRGIKSGHHFTWQGKRIVEDAYDNLAAGKPVKASQSNSSPAVVTDGDKSDGSTWVSNDGSGEKWVEIDLGARRALGSAVVYTGSSYGVYTSPDRVKNFKLQAHVGGAWKDIPGATEKNGRYAQVFIEFDKPVVTDRVRWISTDPGELKVREVKLFARGDGPSVKPDYNISGIQRAGEVVRLFARGFKDQRPLLETIADTEDPALDRYTAYDADAGNYYVWLVNRNTGPYEITLDVRGIDLPPGSAVTAETVSEAYYGEVTDVLEISKDRRMALTLPPQSVALLTAPTGTLAKTTVTPSADATVTGGENADKAAGGESELSVQLDAAEPANNKVAYIHFPVPPDASKTVRRALLRMSGKVTSGDAPYRLHVYGIPGKPWDQQKLTWSNAPLLDATEALLHEVGQKAFVAGQIAFTTEHREHMLDVTQLVQKHGAEGMTFVLIRETRQLGDDGDKGRTVVVGSMESQAKPALELWTTKN